MREAALQEAARGVQDATSTGAASVARQPSAPVEKTYARIPAPPLKRLYAWTVDTTILVLLVMVLGAATRGALFSKAAAPQDIFLFLAYFIVPTGVWGRTLGKWVAGIVVVNGEGRTPGVAAAIPREVAWKVVAYGAAGLGLLWIDFDRERRGWHDRLAGTWVVVVPDAGAPFFGKLFRQR